MGLFDKKYCSVCGEKIGLLGNRKLEDGNLCKSCAAKLSPWFDDRRNSTVEQIMAQLAYREENKRNVEAFATTRIFGDGWKLRLDEDHGAFMIARTGNISNENPDVVPFSDITGCDFRIDKRTTEIKKKGADGKQESYKPERYRHDFDFNFTVFVNHPYFDDMSFKLNNFTVTVSDEENVGTGRRLMARTELNPEDNEDYRRYVRLGNELKDILMNAREQARGEAPVKEEKPDNRVSCRYCGELTVPTADDRCEYCGGSLHD